MPGMSSVIGQYPAGVRLLSLLESEVDSKALATKLTQAIEQLLQEATTTKGTAAVPASTPVGSSSEPSQYLENVQLLAPRGKFDLGFTDSHLLLRARQNNHNSAQVPWSDLEHVVVVDVAPNDKDGSKGLLALVAKRGAHIQHGKAKLQVVIMQVSSTQDVSILPPPTLADMAGPDGQLTGPAIMVLCQLVGGLLPNAGEHTFFACDTDTFASSSGKLYLEANIKAQQGWLYPLAGALLYVGRPALFLRSGDITSLDLLRAGGGSSTFDLELGVGGGAGLVGVGARLELGQIATEELPRLQAYIQSQRLQAQPSAGAAGAAGAAGVAAAEEGMSDEDEDEEEDSDFDPEAKSAPKRRRVDPAAAGSSTAAAAAAADSSDEEDGEGSAEEDEDEDEDSDDVSLVNSEDVLAEDD